MRKKRFAWNLFLVLLLQMFLSLELHAQSALKLPSFFSDHMVVQREKPIAIWGWAEPGAQVTVTFHDDVVETTTGKDGMWKTNLGPQVASGEGASISIKSGESTLEIKDVLVGEVWFASGQSNMYWSLNKTENAEEAAQRANYPGIRMFLAEMTPAREPQTDIGGNWNICNPENAPEFSATAYYFARKLHIETGMPIGIIRSCWGGKRCECYCSREALMANPHGKKMVEELEEQDGQFDPVKAEARFAKQMEAWQKKRAEIQKFNRGVDKDKRKKFPRKPVLAKRPMENERNPTVLFNGMINPFVGYTMRGAIWYQGEANASEELAPIYREMMCLMIDDWRSRWDDEFPFYFVQLANFSARSPENWVVVQDQQRLTLKHPKTGMATINDIGMSKNIHPVNKRDVGYRLARWALNNEYGRSMVVSGPLFKTATSSDGKVTVEFDHVGSGLKFRDNTESTAFEVHNGSEWVKAKARISKDKQTVILEAEGVELPSGVRYAWLCDPSGHTLVNSEGLPTSCFMVKMPGKDKESEVTEDAAETTEPEPEKGDKQSGDQAEGAGDGK